MIDSLNLIIYNVKWLDFKRIITLGVNCVKKFNNSAYSFKYKNVEFKYNKLNQYLLIKTKVGEILNKDDITLSDKEEYKKIMINIIKDVLPELTSPIFVSRIDYKVDILVLEKMSTYLNLLNRHSRRFNYMRKKTEYETSLRLSNKYGKTNLNFYDKYEERNSKNKEAEKYEGILRLEIQCKPTMLNKEQQKYIETEKQEGRIKTIDEYWNKEAMELYYFEFLKSYLYEGDYYNRDMYKELVNNSTLTELEKKRLIRFSLMESRYGINGLVDKKKISYYTVRKYVKMLNDLDINPITIPDDSEYESLENLLKEARNTAKGKYFK